MALSDILQTQNLAFQRLPKGLGNRLSSVGELIARRTMADWKEQRYGLIYFFSIPLSRINNGDGGDDENDNET